MKAKKIRFWYSVFLSAFTLVMGVLFIVQAVRILADGGWIQGAFTREIVAERLFPISIPFYIWIAAVIVGYVLSLFYPVAERKVNKVSERVTQKRLAARLPQGEGAEYEADMRRVCAERRNRAIVYAVCAALCLAGGIASAVYLLNPAHFTAENINSAMLNMLANVGPWVLVAFGCCIGMTFYEKYSLNSEINVLKRVIKSNKGNPVVVANTPHSAALVKFKAIATSKYTVWGVRGAFAVLGITFLLLGIFNESARDVLIKAVNICTECIGLG